MAKVENVAYKRCQCAFFGREVLWIEKSGFWLVEPDNDSWAIASLVLPSFATLSFQKDLDHRGGSDDPGGSVLFQGEEFLIAGHQELGLAGFSQREQEAVLGVRSDGAGGQVSAKKREVAKASGEQFGHAGAKSRPEERPPGNVAEFRNERVTGDETEPLALPSVEKFGWRAQG